MDMELTQILKRAQKSLTNEEEMQYMSNLLNLIRNIKRFIYDNKTRTFPSCYSELTTEGLVPFINDINQLRKYNKVVEVQMLKTDKYLKLAESLCPDAEKYYYVKN